MSSKRIESWNASAIGKAVAEKAFDHITAPLRENLRAALEHAYWHELSTLGLTREVHDKLLLARGDGGNHNVELVWKTPQDSHHDFRLWCKEFKHGHNKDNSKTPTPFTFRRLCMKDKTTLVPVEASVLALRPWDAKINAMAEDIAKQINGRTVTVVLKAWPEIKPFVYEVLGIEELFFSSPTPVPFQDLLNRHLLALPAPAQAKPVKRVK